MSTLLDTSILTRGVYKSDPLHQIAIDAVDKLARQGERLVLAPQNYYEFWVVCTRPVAQNGLGMTPAEVESEFNRLERLFSTLDDTSAILPEWRRIVSRYQVVGKNGHDARLVSSMTVHGVNKILTFNTQDFQRYQGITVLDPRHIAATS